LSESFGLPTRDNGDSDQDLEDQLGAALIEAVAKEHRMKVFIGWSGDRSQKMGLALREWIPLVLHYAEPWVSETDIAAGERWAHAVGKELENSNFGIIGVTRENVSSQWILFEAGALSKPMEDSRVVPLLLDLELSEISGPLAQFQAKKATRSGMLEVIQSINKSAPQPIDDPRVTQLFDALWPTLEDRLTSIPEPEGAKPLRPQQEILEELVAGVRSLDSRLRESEDGSLSPSVRRRRGRFGRVHPFLFEELSRAIGQGRRDPIGLLIVTSAFREDLPWMYELGLEAYRAAKTGDMEEYESCVRRIRVAADMLTRGPFGEELGIHPRDLDIMFMALEKLFGEETPILAEATPKPKPKRTRPSAAQN
jgi:TIR domain